MKNEKENFNQNENDTENLFYNNDENENDEDDENDNLIYNVDDDERDLPGPKTFLTRNQDSMSGFTKEYKTYNNNLENY